MTHAKLPAAARELVSVCVEVRDMGQASADLAGQSVRHRTAQARARLAWHREVSGPLHLSVVDPKRKMAFPHSSRLEAGKRTFGALCQQPGGLPFILRNPLT